MSKRAESIFLAGLLLVLSAAEALVLYFPTDPGRRVVAGILLLAPIILVGSKLGVVDHLLRAVGRTVFTRRHRRLRALVEQVLEEVRRLNRIAVDGKRGVRPPETTNELLDSVEVRMQDLVVQIRANAGEEHEEPLEVQG